MLSNLCAVTQSSTEALLDRVMFNTAKTGSAQSSPTPDDYVSPQFELCGAVCSCSAVSDRLCPICGTELEIPPVVELKSLNHWCFYTLSGCMVPLTSEPLTHIAKVEMYNGRKQVLPICQRVWKNMSCCRVMFTLC